MSACRRSSGRLLLGGVRRRRSRPLVQRPSAVLDGALLLTAFDPRLLVSGLAGVLRCAPTLSGVAAIVAPLHTLRLCERLSDAEERERRSHGDRNPSKATLSHDDAPSAASPAATPRIRSEGSKSKPADRLAKPGRTRCAVVARMTRQRIHRWPKHRPEAVRWRWQSRTGNGSVSSKQTRSWRTLRSRQSSAPRCPWHHRRRPPMRNRTETA